MKDLSSTVYEFDSYRLDAGKRVLFDASGDVLPLMPKAFDTLVYLVGNSGRVVDKDELFREVWPDTIVEENNLTQNISILRKTLGEKPGQHRFIVTVPGRGYRFVADVVTANAEKPLIRQANEDLTRAQARSGRPLLIVLVLAVVLGLGSVAFYLSRPAPALAEIRTIAVLPFKPLTSDSRNESLELGMADSLISRLSDGGDLVVRPLFSVRRFTSPEEDPLAAGQSLAVEAVLDGTIQMSDDQVRVSARLLNVSDGRQIWAEQFDESRTHLFQVQDSIADRVAAALNVKLRSQKRSGTDSFEAYESYMLGRLHSLRLVMPEVKKGISYFERAIDQDPEYALAHVGIAEAQRALVLSNDLDPQIAFAQAKQAAARAVELSPDIGETHLALGMIAFFYDWDWERSEKHLKKAIELNPNDAESHIYYAHLLSNLGRHDEAMAEARRARELNPVSTVIRTIEALIFEQAGQFDAAKDSLETTIGIDPNFWLARHFLSSVYTHKGQYGEAIVQSDEAKRLAPFQTHSMAFKGVALARAGDSKQANEIIEEFNRLSRDRYVPPCHLALLYAAIGDHDRAIEYLEKGYREKDVRIIFLKVDRRWDPLRSDPRFVDLMTRLKF